MSFHALIDHPECQKGEMCALNCTPVEFHKVPLNSKRMGEVAYDSDGNPYDEALGLRPVFAGAVEVMHFIMNSKELGFNYDEHPELQEGERFLSNITPDEFAEIPSATKRMGELAYSIYGTVLEASKNHFPVFVDADEYDKVYEDWFYGS